MDGETHHHWLAGRPSNRRHTPENFADRFWSRVDRSGGHDACWPWLGTTNGDSGRRGRVHLRYEGKWIDGKRPKRVRAYAYVVAWELTNGPIPEGLHPCHNCPGGDNPNCVNPSHCFLGTQKDNVQDMAKKGKADFFGHQKEALSGGPKANRRRGERVGDVVKKEKAA